MIKDRDERPKGFGYVEFGSLDDLKGALERSGTVSTALHGFRDTGGGGILRGIAAAVGYPQFAPRNWATLHARCAWAVYLCILSAHVELRYGMRKSSSSMSSCTMSPIFSRTMRFTDAPFFRLSDQALLFKRTDTGLRCQGYHCMDLKCTGHLRWVHGQRSFARLLASK